MLNTIANTIIYATAIPEPQQPNATATTPSSTSRCQPKTAALPHTAQQLFGSQLLLRMFVTVDRVFRSTAKRAPLTWTVINEKCVEQTKLPGLPGPGGGPAAGGDDQNGEHDGGSASG